MMANSVHVRSGALTTSTSPHCLHRPENVNLHKNKADHPAGPGLASPRDAETLGGRHSIHFQWIISSSHSENVACPVYIHLPTSLAALPCCAFPTLLS